MNTQNRLRTRMPKIQVAFNPKRSMKHRIYVTKSGVVYDLCKEVWNLDTIDLYEEFYVFFLDRRNGIIGYRQLGRGTVCGVIANMRLTFAIALACNASGIIICHNHPSGRTEPSHDDHKLTSRMHQTGQLFNMKLVDHLIICRDSFFSFQDDGCLG